jgi:hypothetical protein
MSLRTILSRNKILYNLLFLAANRKTFSQSGEDLIISKWFHNEKGRYVDVGSGEPIRGSNSYLFYRKGWRGILIDPIKSNNGANRFLRPSDKSINALIGPKASRNFWIFEPYQYSTMDEKVAKDLISFGKIKFVKKAILNTVPLSNIVFESSPTDPTFLTIDVEGVELDVLKSNDWEKFKPRLICTEVWFSETDDKNISIEGYLAAFGYACVQKEKTTWIFVHNTFLAEINKKSL